MLKSSSNQQVISKISVFYLLVNLCVSLSIDCKNKIVKITNLLDSTVARF